MDKKLIYLDNNATTKVDDRVLEAMLPYLKNEYGNPSSMYDFAKNPAKALKEARGKLKDFFNAANEKEIIFTSCGSESANTAIRGVLNMNPNKKHIITTKVEHPCVLNLYQTLEKEGYTVDYIGVNSNGELDLAQLEEAIHYDTALVSVMYANNETGVIFPIQKISEIIKNKNPQTKFFVDAVQVAGKIPIDVQALGVDLMGISGHKFHAPKGVGALYCNSKTIITPLIIGGHQERGKRAGTENVPYIIGLGKAAEIAQDFLKYEATEVKRLRDKLETGILKNVFNARLNTGAALRVPNTSNIGFEYIEGELILLHLSDLGICASSGSACTSGSLEPSHVLRAMNVPFTAIHGSIRFSLSKYTTEAEIDYVNEVLPGIIEKIRNISPYQDELAELKKQKHFV
ncbi:cysteine desulfurase NifS [Spirochaetes bacterium]|uniref:Cysteine desulfurase n=1 Tax=Candidatus Scatousia excrementipullorum TaxID=2840936 RepID=A0A9D9H1L8_9BACT|nr:cysteine desulfurase NifS [Candidatus Scatousia excrementipullorum]